MSAAAAPDRPPRVGHIITTTNTGGAEKLLAACLARWRGRFDSSVLCLAGEGPVAGEIRDGGATLECLGLAGPLPRPAAYLRARRWFKATRPDVLVGWMYHGDWLATHGWRLLKRAPRLVWTLHQTPERMADEKLPTRLLIRRLARLSPGADVIIHTSESSRRRHAELGYDDRRAVVIRNGVDTELFRPDPEARRSVRGELGLPEDAPLVGRFARFDPMKDHAACLAAFAGLRRRAPQLPVHLLLAGLGASWDNADFRRLAAAHGFTGEAVAGRLHALGPRRDLPRLQAALDLALSTSSMKETFPLALGEAMACGVPCLATDVGDSAILVGDAGLVVPPRDPAALTEAMLNFFGLPAHVRASLGRAARRRMAERFPLEDTAERYAARFAGTPGIRLEST